MRQQAVKVVRNGQTAAEVGRSFGLNEGAMAPRSETPMVKVTWARYSVALLSALSSRGDFRFMVHEGTVMARVFRAFLRRLLVGHGGPCPGLSMVIRPIRQNVCANLSNNREAV
jgi:hypothetical protein